MKKMILFLGCCLLGWGAIDAFAQQGFVVSGGEASGTGGLVSFSIGQINYASASSADHIIIEGIQQSGDNITNIEETEINLTALVYPNPTTEFLTLKVENGEFNNLSFVLYDEQGKLLLSRRFEGNETNVNVTHLPPSKYFIKVINENKEIKSFKIIKL
jgi:hypothetical protein